MMEEENKRYSCPQLILQQFAAEDVITASSDNIGGIPDGWYGADMMGGEF